MGAALVACAAAVVSASPALALDGLHVKGTWTLRDKPGGAAIGTLAAGRVVTVDCQAVNPTVTVSGFGTSAIWDHVPGVGYVSDLAIVETSYAVRDPRIVGCPTATPPTPAPVHAPATGRSWGLTEATNTAYAGQCTWGAKDQFHAATGRYPAIHGNARDYAASARAAGWTVVADAQPRSIVVFQPGVQGANRLYGHVAWVESVENRADGLYAHILEMNGTAGPYRWDRRVLKDIAGMSYVLAP